MDRENKKLLIELDLQYFAKMGPGGEKTEQPTAKKLEDSRKEGQVAKSQELSGACSLLAMFIVLKFGCSYLAKSFLGTFHLVYNKIPDMTVLWNNHLEERDYSGFISMIMMRIILAMAPFLLVGFAVAFVTNVVQVKWKPTLKPLKPKFSKLNPINGVKRLFSVEKLIELLKSIIKVAVIYYVVSGALKDKIGLLMNLYDLSLNSAIQITGQLVIDVGLRISLVYIVVGFADFGYQKWKFKDDMKMTKQEVKDEMKNSEGDPAVKGQQKRRMREASQRRMMQNIPQADVVITNPTHFAVALQYDSEIADAPIVVAKGADHLAQRIKDIARENGVEIVEDKPLARMLYHNVELGGLVPPELYQAVAEVLAFVYNLKKNRAS